MHARKHIHEWMLNRHRGWSVLLLHCEYAFDLLMKLSGNLNVGDDVALECYVDLIVTNSATWSPRCRNKFLFYVFLLSLLKTSCGRVASKSFVGIPWVCVTWMRLRMGKITLYVTHGGFFSCFHCLTFPCKWVYLFIKRACWSDGLSLLVFTFLKSAVAGKHPVKFVISGHPGKNWYPGTWLIGGIIKTPHRLQHFHFYDTWNALLPPSRSFG